MVEKSKSSSNKQNMMHPRNRYRETQPNFAQLAEKYEEFRKCCLVSASGKLNVNFKDPNAVRSLSKVLLKEDFGLNIDIPEDCLVPRIPLRLNYILWIEDLLADNKDVFEKNQISGIDIGTGASCVYPLLSSKLNAWNFLATEKDAGAVEWARKNVEQNGFSDRISIVEVTKDTALVGALHKEGISEEADGHFHFCMCNPPFYDTSDVVCEEDTGYIHCGVGKYKKREETGKQRAPPHSATIARPNEVCADGGELTFVSKIIEDSVKLGNTVSIYTSMLGRKANMAALRWKLREVNVSSMTDTVFHQGKTQRWALAWTFDPRIRLKAAYSSRSKEAQKTKKRPIRVELPGFSYTDAKDKLLQLLDILKVEHKLEENSASCSKFQCNAFENTWSNQRRKRRMNKCSKSETTSGEDSGSGSDAKKPRLESVADSTICAAIRNDANNTIDTAKIERKIEQQTKETILCFSLEIKAECEACYANLEWIDGANKDFLHQIVQFLKNTWAAKSHNTKVNPK